MITIQSTQDPKDTRGLPMSIDPRNFYEYSSAQVVASSKTGLEMLIWKLIPYSYIRSFAIAIDPLYKFKVSQVRITASNRTRYRSHVSAVYDIKRSYHYLAETYQNSTNGLGCGRDDYRLRNRVETFTQSTPYKSTSKYKWQQSDTSAGTRPFGSDYGEAEWFRYYISSPSRNVHYRTEVHKISRSPTCPTDQRTDSTKDYEIQYSSGAYLTPSVIESVRIRQSLDASLKISERGLELVRRAMPTSRNFNLGRSIIELRDVPRSIESLQKTAKDLASAVSHLPKGIKIFDLKANLNNIPTEYLSYSFGWRQLYNDVMDLLFKPKLVTKRINRLITRNGLNTTFRSHSKLNDSYESSSGFTYLTDLYDFSPISTKSYVKRRFDLQCVINAKFEFPPIDPVTFRADLFRKMMGVTPSPADLYDLVPWTWLYDWFTGFGNYLHIIEEITSDRSLINFGFVSCKTTGSLVTQYMYRGKDDASYQINFGPTTTNINWYSLQHCSTLDFTHYVRKDVTSITNVRATSDMASLTPYQQTILGALFAQRNRV